MKKTFLLTCMLLTTLLIGAQSIKKVAIPEVVDKEGKLSYAQKVLLRSTMARAITNREGYEAYDRTDVDVILSEHAFQRTGYVSDEQIKRLGEMTGVSYILVTEGIPVGTDHIFVSARIIDIETAKVEMMDNITTSTNSDDMQQNCNTLIRRMIGASNSEKEYRKRTDTNALVASTFIPGLGQMLKKQSGSGAAFMVSEVALFAGGSTCYFLRQKQLKTMKAAGTSYNDYKAAKDRKGTLDVAMYACFGVGAAVHIANMVHAWFVKDKNLPMTITFVPAVIPVNELSTPSYATGAGVQITF